ncbi:Nulp1-pending protein [Cordyceps militaris]|uniref:Nulp1-pending protein n=1 Tax=Cordyceps militaris TaxID=73501 RepID=A0A2H4SAE7_CORMI|nr:Nulp1-pending protein [Cordyceps militaris]
MSSRQLRKLQKQRELEEALKKQTLESEQAEESEEEPVPVARPKPNLFAALGGEDDDADAEAEEDDDDTHGAMTEPAVSEQTPSAMAKKSKKKKKKSKKKATAVVAAEDEDEIDKAIHALNPVSIEQHECDSDDLNVRRALMLNKIFQINTQNLRVINEMRSLFGREVIESADAEEERQHQEVRRGRGTQGQQVDLETFLRSQPPNAKKLPEVSRRRNVFVQGRDHWPAASANGLTMRETRRSPDEVRWVEYAWHHEGEYDQLQALFFAVVQEGQPMRMVSFVARLPYHVSTLMQVSFIAKQDQNMALSAELCERALFTLGRVTTSAFRRDLEQGRARLDFCRPENRQFWLAGYHYLRSLLRKGTYRTALEWAKILYILDPRDPYAIRHYLHFLAVRAHQPQWLLEFLEYVQGDKSTMREDIKYVKQSGILARLQMGETETAGKELAEGMQTVPWLYCALFQELGLDAPPSIWGTYVESSEEDERKFWIKLYLHFAKDLWNNTQAMALLTDVAGHLEKVRVMDLPRTDAEPGLDATRLAYLEGQTSILGVAPRALLQRQPNYDFDPMPPTFEENVFDYPAGKLPWADQDPDEGWTTAYLQRIQNDIRARGGGGGNGQRIRGLGVGGQQFEGEESDYDDVTDEELRRDLEEHARRSNAPGYLGQLMQMLGLGGGGGSAAQGGEDEAAGVEEQGDDMPGAWRQ